MCRWKAAGAAEACQRAAGAAEACAAGRLGPLRRTPEVRLGAAEAYAVGGVTGTGMHEWYSGDGREGMPAVAAASHGTLRGPYRGVV
ncbi:hypothetical protein GCM10025331_32640 [Actinoplanes utahensis]|nr:hypothetical protein Aut01nite_48750 [Actinoplanes utahensis]